MGFGSLSYMTGAFDDREWMKVYKEAYKNVQTGGWIEHVGSFSSHQQAIVTSY